MGQTPNLVNVAVSRAEHALYVIGDRNLWSSVDHFKELADALPLSSERLTLP